MTTIRCAPLCCGCSVPPASRRAATRRRATSCCIRRLIGPAACCSICACRAPPVSSCRRPCSEQGVTLPVVFLTGHADVASSVRAMKAGAVDFLTKPVKRDTLLDALQRALARDAHQRTARDEADRLHARFASLTPREREVFDRIVAGKLNKQIAAELGIAERTVKSASRAGHGQAGCRLGGRARPAGGAAATPVRTIGRLLPNPHPRSDLRAHRPLGQSCCPFGQPYRRTRVAMNGLGILSDVPMHVVSHSSAA